jgi:hypothetical protein
MNIKQYFSSQFLFQFNTAYVSPREKLVFFVGIILLLLAAVLKISGVLAASPVDTKYRQKFYHLFLTIGLGEIFWYLCRYENVTFLGSHFIAMLWAVIGVIWFVAIAVSIFKHYKEEKTVWEKEQVRMKYLPQ